MSQLNHMSQESSNQILCIALKIANATNEELTSSKIKLQRQICILEEKVQGSKENCAILTRICQERMDIIQELRKQVMSLGNAPNA